MVEAAQYNFELKEVIEALIKAQGLSEGLWGLGIEFGFSAATMGPTAEDARPTGLVQIMRLQLVKQAETNPSVQGIVDASKINSRIEKTQKISMKSNKKVKKTHP